MMKWFGPPGGAAFEQDCPHVSAPADGTCAWCGEAVDEQAGGVLLPLVTEEGPRELAYHHDCHLRQVIGGLNHVLGRCLCCGGAEEPDPKWLSLRQSATEAVAAWQRKHR